MSLADLSTPQIKRLLIHAKHLKTRAQLSLPPKKAAMARLAEEMAQKNKKWTVPEVQQTLDSATIALLFSKRSTRTRVAAESAAKLLGGQALFLGKDDIQLGVNESARDTARVISGMCQGIFARVGEHEEIEVCVSSFLLDVVF
jgi:ornithine carbamoyltransferase